MEIIQKTDSINIWIKNKDNERNAKELLAALEEDQQIDYSVFISFSFLLDMAKQINSASMREFLVCAKGVLNYLNSKSRNLLVESILVLSQGDDLSTLIEVYLKIISMIDFSLYTALANTGSVKSLNLSYSKFHTKKSLI